MISTTNQGSVTLLRLEHGKANALDLELLLELDSKLREFEASEQRALVITGRGSIFGAGVDLVRLSQGNEGYVSQFLEALDRTFRTLYSMEKPAVAAINGHAIAGGCILALACEYRLMSEGRGTMGVTELYVGVPFPPMALEILRASLAPHVFQELVFTGRLCNPADCQSMGLVHRVTAPEALEVEAIKMASRMGSVLPSTYAMSKREMRAGTLQRIEDEQERHGATIRKEWLSPPVQGAIRQFLESTIKKKS